MSSSSIIRITNASFYAYHGVATDEQTLGGKFEVDVELTADLSDAMSHDSLKQTTNYETVYGLVQKIVTAKKYFLIEALANTIAKGILQSFGGVKSVKVRVRKPHPPVKGVVDYVEVEVSVQR
jgi:dihydroneopterin aldolase